MTPEQFVEGYRAYLPAISRYLTRRVPIDDVEDIAAGVFEIAWAKRASVIQGEELPWLYRIASLQVANYRRRKASATRYLLNVISQDAAPSAETIAVFDLDLAKAWASLSHKDRQLLSLVAFEGLSVSQAALATGISPNAASSRLHRSRQKLTLKLSVQDSND